ncbi:phosphatidylserine decarboxylase 1 [Kappamyces sp. JEL0829]|nr:phosphatidylserine decarboxylase 1 [Kappamyces sp. JEL0829]
MFRFLHRISRVEQVMPIGSFARLAQESYHPVHTRLVLRRSFQTKEGPSPIMQKLKQSWNGTRTSAWYPIPIALGVAWIALSHLYKLSQRPDDTDAVHTKIEGPLYLRLYASLPLRYLSHCWGWINDLTLPPWLRKPVYLTYSYLCGCNLDEMLESDLAVFENLGQFFYRKIRPECRPIDTTAAMVSPSDGKVLHYGIVQGTDEIEQVKGVSYSLSALLGPRDDNDLYSPIKPGHTLYFCVIYLAPGDYHRFHSPTEWKMNLWRHFAGEMFSVNPGLVGKLKNLFTLNERVSMMGSWHWGFFGIVPVAATNVGKIVLNCAPNLLTNVPKKKLNRPLGSHIEEKILALDGSPLTFKRGEEMGGFKLGSTLVLVFEAPADKGVFHVSPGDKSFLSMSRIEEFPESQIIPYDTPALVTSSIHFSLGVIGVLAVGLVLLSTAGEKNKTPGTLLLLSLCWADLVFCLAAVVFGALDLHAGKVGCVIDGVIVFFSCCLSILSLLSITLERYLLTIWSYPTTIKMAWMWTIGMWGNSIIFALIPIITVSWNYSIAVAPILTNCAGAWWDTHPWTYVLKIIAVMVILSTVIGMTYCYYAIVLLYVNALKKIRSMGNALVARASMAASQIESVPVTSPKVNEHSVDILSIREKRLMFTAITITGCFVFLWTPYLIMMIAEMITGVPVPVGWDVFCTLLAHGNSAINPFLLYAFDNRIRTNINQILGIKSKSSSSTSSSATAPEKVDSSVLKSIP